MADEKINPEEKMYHLICKERFDKMNEKQDQIIDLLRGKNGQAGLLDDVRTLKRRWIVIYSTAGIVAIAFVKEVISWLFHLV